MKKTYYAIIILLFQYGLVFAQSRTYELHKKLEIDKALKLIKNSDFGIKSASNSVIVVKVYDEILYKSEYIDRKDALIYGFQSEGNTGTNYSNISFGINERQNWLTIFGAGRFYYDSSNSYVYDNSNSLAAFRKAIRDRQHYTYKSKRQSFGFYSLSDGTIDVVVEVTIRDQSKLSDILGIKIPGLLVDIQGKDFTISNPKTFAFIGNYGCSNNQDSKDVATYIKNFIKPDVIISAGNDSYHRLTSNNCGTSYNDNTGTLYSNWLNTVNGFSSVLGSMDYSNGINYIGTTGENEWKTFFNHSEVNYVVDYGDKIDLFMINTNKKYPDSDPRNDADLIATKNWLADKLSNSKKQYKIVVGHHSTQGSGQNNSRIRDWNFQSMGADMYVSSQGNYYERLNSNGIPHVNVGLGGYSKDTADYTSSYPSSLVKNTHFSAEFGSLKATVGGNNIRLEFMTVSGKKIDEFYLFGYESTNPSNNYYIEKFRGSPISSNTETFDIYLLLGQSNAGGRCGWLCFREFLNGLSGELPNSYLLNEKNLFEHATNSLGRYSTTEKYVFNTGLGVGWSFAKKLNTAGKKIGLISNARGGVETEQWFPNYTLIPAIDGNYGEYSMGYSGKNLYNETKDRYMAAKIKYPNARLKGVIWMQGESDAKNINVNNYDYTTRTSDLIKHFRNDYGDPNLKFYLTEVSYKPTIKGDWEHTRLNEQIHAVARVNSNVYVANVKDLSTFDEIDVHWTNDSYIVLGERLADLVTSDPNSINNKIVSTANSLKVNELYLSDNVTLFPNPSKDGTFNLEFKLKEAGNISLEIFDLLGQSIYKSQSKKMSNGTHIFQFHKSDMNLSIGLYVLQLVTNEFTEKRKLIVE